MEKYSFQNRTHKLIAGIFLFISLSFFCFAQKNHPLTHSQTKNHHHPQKQPRRSPADERSAFRRIRKSDS